MQLKHKKIPFLLKNKAIMHDESEWYLRQQIHSGFCDIEAAEHQDTLSA